MMWDNMDICLNCGEPITKKSHNKNKRKYCSRECWREHKGLKKTEYKITVCDHCGKTFKETRDRPNIYCSRKCSMKARQMREAYYKEHEDERKKKLQEELRELLDNAEDILHLIKYERRCKICGRLFVAKSKTNICCSSICSTRNENRMKDNRIYKNGKPDMTINLTRLFIRDKGVCQICGKDIDFDCDPNSGEYPSVDHIIPLSKGGLHSWDNVQLACRRCNWEKGDRTNPPPGF